MGNLSKKKILMFPLFKYKKSSWKIDWNDAFSVKPIKCILGSSITKPHSASLAIIPSYKFSNPQSELKY